LKKTKEFLNWNYEEEFYVPKEVKENSNKVIESGKNAENEWDILLQNYKEKYPELALEWDLWYKNELSVDLLKDEEFWKFTGEKATRVASFEVINRLAKIVPNLIGGSADLSPSNKTYMNGKGDFSSEDRSGANLHFGVREHAMAAIANGVCVHGGLKIFVSTFFIFSDYMKRINETSSCVCINSRQYRRGRRWTNS